MNNQIIQINIDDIVLDSAQPRQDWKNNEAKLEILAKDIEKNGLYYPILASPYYKNDNNELVLGDKALKHEGRKWWILDGERRVRCHIELKRKTIDAIVRTELTLLEMMKIQFASNTKRLSVTITEMSKAIARYREEFAKENKDYEESELIDSLCELTGYSATYFDSVEAINRSDDDMKEKVLSERVGGYAPSEIEKATKNENFRRGLTDAYVESNKPISALAPRALKHDLMMAEKEDNLNSKKQRTLAYQMMKDFTSQNDCVKDKKPNYLLYQHEANKFFRTVKRWNLKGLKQNEIGSLIGAMEDIYNYFKENRRLNNQILKTNSHNINER
jgi:hypothetical protein